jgi:Ca2+-binding EF-hand superfamily protein
MDASAKKQLILSINNPATFEPIAKEAFDAADKNHNGTIDKKELELCMKEVSSGLGLDAPNQKAVENEFKKLDIDKNGTIDFNEFKVFVKESMKKIIGNM